MNKYNYYIKIYEYYKEHTTRETELKFGLSNLETLRRWAKENKLSLKGKIGEKFKPKSQKRYTLNKIIEMCKYYKEYGIQELMNRYKVERNMLAMLMKRRFGLKMSEIKNMKYEDIDKLKEV